MRVPRPHATILSAFSHGSSRFCRSSSHRVVTHQTFLILANSDTAHSPLCVSALPASRRAILSFCGSMTSNGVTPIRFDC